MGRLVFVLGGARSGKSRFAQEYAWAEAGEDVLYVATATVTDDEMTARVARHREDRPAAWETVELPLRAGETLLARGALQEVETRLGEGKPAFTHQKRLEPRPERVQMQHVARGIGQLLAAQLGRSPVGGLLLLAQLDAEQFAAKVLQPMPIGERADQLGRDLGAFDGRAGYSERVLQRGHVKTGEVHQLDDAGITHHGRQVGRDVAAAAQRNGHELHHVGSAVAGGQLHQAQPVAVQVQSHRLGVDGDDRTKAQAVRKVVAVKMKRRGRHELCDRHC